MAYHINKTWVHLDADFTTGVRGVYGTLCLIVIITGVLGNFFVCMVVLRSKMKRNSTDILIANLAIVDLIQCLNFISIFITLVCGRWSLGHVGCQISGYLTISMVATSLYLLGLISVNRHTLINDPDNHEKIFTIRNTVMMIACVWLVSLVAASPPLYGYKWAAYVFRSRRSLCMMDFHTSGLFYLMISGVILMPPVLVIAWSYWKIFKTIKQSRRQIRNEMQISQRDIQRTDQKIESNLQISLQIVADDSDKRPSGRSLRRDTDSIFSRKLDPNHPHGDKAMFRTTFMLFVIVFIFFVVYTPTLATNVIEIINPNIKFNVWMDLLFVIIAYANHAINPIAYGVMNKQYRKAFVKSFWQ
eukprot:Seg11181.1 transcript_id=Seg11181.1/GoldUCD/mRNA.D3Y31 product="G-protein coupled receptor moody" protein_id=Seg11181.1/GoldUCD/D3Y31